MKRSLVEENTGTLHGNKLPRSEIEKMISEKVSTAVELSDFKMGSLMERIVEVKREPSYDERVKKLDAQELKLKRRGEAVFSYVKKLRALVFPRDQQCLSSVRLKASDIKQEKCISPPEPSAFSPLSSPPRVAINTSGCLENTSTIASSSGDTDNMNAVRKPKKGFWLSQLENSNIPVVDLTEDDQELSKRPVTTTIVINDAEESISGKDSVSSSVELEEANWLSKLHPFPDTPFPAELPVKAASFNLPQKPLLKLARIGQLQEIGIAWNVDKKDPYAAEMDSYCIFFANELKDGSFSKWKSLGVIKAMPLPMACKVSTCKGNRRLCVVIVGKDVFERYGPYSDVHSVGIDKT